MGAREHRDSDLEQPSGLVGALAWRLSQLRWAGLLHLGTGEKARQRQPDSRGGGEYRGRQEAKAHEMEHILSYPGRSIAWAFSRYVGRRVLRPPFLWW